MLLIDDVKRLRYPDEEAPMDVVGGLNLFMKFLNSPQAILDSPGEVAWDARLRPLSYTSDVVFITPAGALMRAVKIIPSSRAQVRILEVMMWAFLEKWPALKDLGFATGSMVWWIFHTLGMEALKGVVTRAIQMATVLEERAKWVEGKKKSKMEFLYADSEGTYGPLTQGITFAEA